MSDDELLDRFRRSAALADATVSAVRPDQLDDPTPCTQWTVRQLLNHMTGGNLFFLSLGSGAPPPDRAADHVGADHVASFRASLDQLSALFNEPGFLDREVSTPFGPGVGRVLVGMRFNENLVHSWDVARATGQSTDLEPGLAGVALASLQAAPMVAQARGEGGMFGAEQSAPAGAPVADRLAAFAGRVVE